MKNQLVIKIVIVIALVLIGYFLFQKLSDNVQQDKEEIENFFKPLKSNNS